MRKTEIAKPLLSTSSLQEERQGFACLGGLLTCIGGVSFRSFAQGGAKEHRYFLAAANDLNEAATGTPRDKRTAGATGRSVKVGTDR